MKRFAPALFLAAACGFAAIPGSARLLADDPKGFPGVFPGADAKAAKPRGPVKLPSFFGPEDTRPAPKPVPGRVAVGKGQHYVIPNGYQLLVLKGGPGDVTIKTRKPPFMLPVDLAVGHKGDAGEGADPAFVTFTEPFIYDVMPAKTGAVGIELIPALNATNEKGEQIPLTEADVQRVTLDVTADGPAPPPDPVNPPKPPGPPEPPAPVVPDADPVLLKAFQAAALKDAAAKKDLVALGKVYTSTAGILSVNDPNVRPATFGVLYTNLVDASINAGVPRLPALANVRAAVDAEVGRYAPNEPITDALRASLAAKFTKVGAALAAAGK